MEPRMIHIEHAPSSNNAVNSTNQFQYTSQTNLNDMNNSGRFPTGFELHSSSRHQTPSLAQEASHSHAVHSHYDYANNAKVFQEEEQLAKKSTQTTTTTKTVQQPSYMVSNVDEERVPFNTQRYDVFQPINSPAAYMKQTSVEIDNNPNSYTIKVQHHPKEEAFNWSNLDVYLHIFLTFYFGHFAAMLFFDGVLRNIVNLYVMEHSTGSVFLYIFHIVFSIALLAFTIWFMTICWRWWRYKSLSPDSAEYAQQPLKPRANQATAHGHVFISAVILILGFFIFLALGSIDLAYKRTQVLNSDFFKQYNESLYMADMIVFIFRLVFWLVGIIATTLLSREVLYKYCCPSKHIKINKERPTTVYEVQG